MSDIFISYASEDQKRVESLAQALAKKGWSVWWDRRIPIGRSFDEVIEEAVDASKAVVVVWTQTSVKSQWVKNEAREGLRRRVLFPVVILEEVKIPLEFRDVQAAHLMDWQPAQDHAGFDQFVEDLAQVIGAPVTPGVRLSGRGDEVEPDSELQKQKHPSESTGPAPSTESPPYLSMGLGLLAAGALVYFMISSQGPSPGERDQSQFRPAEQSPSARTEVITPAAVPEAIKQTSTATTQEKAVAKQETAGSGTEAKPRPMAGPAKTITGNDGAPMVLVPAGEFMMGSRQDDKDGDYDDRPAHPVFLDAYYIDQYEVTTARYAKFFQETKRPAPEDWSKQVLKQHGRKPVVGVDWNDAGAYCAWAGKRLPTEAEWEKAARGTDQRLYPWGNDKPTEQRANFDQGEDFKDYGVLTDVGSFEQGKSPYGAYDMAGNVWEWVADWYDGAYYSKSPARNPRGPSGGQYRVLRGGSWFDEPVLVRSASRYRSTLPSVRLDYVGFRCAQDAPGLQSSFGPRDPVNGSTGLS